MQKLVISILFVFLAVQVQADEPKALALVVQATGKSEIVRAGKPVGVKVNELVKKGDVLRTLADGTMSVQLSTGAIFRMAPGTEVVLQDLVRDNSGFRVRLDVKRGSLASKLDKLGKSDAYVVSTPTAIAGVRGTEFLVEIAQAASAASVMVNDGSVAVAGSEGAQEQVCPSGSKIVSDGKAMVQSLLEIHEKEKMRIFAELKNFQRANFETLVEQQRKNQEMMQQMRQQNSPLDQVQP
ncbi:MAG: FecR domain-containing protein [Leptospirales bacterium]|nr:FecR domain-containing protein [Leptospirales bacterium]